LVSWTAFDFAQGEIDLLKKKQTNKPKPTNGTNKLKKQTQQENII